MLGQWDDRHSDLAYYIGDVEILVTYLGLVHLIPFLLVWVEIEYTEHSWSAQTFYKLVLTSWAKQTTETMSLLSMYILCW